MPIELCQLDDCGKPSEAVAVLVVTSLVGDALDDPVQLVLCVRHARFLAALVRRAGGIRGTD